MKYKYTVYEYVGRHAAGTDKLKNQFYISPPQLYFSHFGEDVSEKFFLKYRIQVFTKKLTKNHTNFDPHTQKLVTNVFQACVINKITQKRIYTNNLPLDLWDYLNTPQTTFGNV